MMILKFCPKIESDKRSISTSFRAPEQGPQQNLDRSAAQKIGLTMHGCIYVEPKGKITK